MLTSRRFHVQMRIETGEYMPTLDSILLTWSDLCTKQIQFPTSVFALDSTTISLSLKLFIWAPGKYSRGAIKIHTLLDLRGNIPSFILVTDGKYQDSNALDELLITPGAIYIRQSLHRFRCLVQYE